VPNYNSFMRRLLGSSWYGWGMPDHVWHFDAKTFRSIMQENGFVPKKLVQNSLYYPYSKSLRKNTRATLARLAGNIGMGDQVYGIFSKGDGALGKKPALHDFFFSKKKPPEFSGSFLQC